MPGKLSQYLSRKAASTLMYPLTSLFGNNSIRILMYHSINIESGNRRLSVKSSLFDEQMAYLHTQGYKTISLTELESSITDRRASHREIVITFDDGYKDNHTYAFPTLRRYGFKATIFLTTDYIDTLKRFWWHEKGDESAIALSWEEIDEMDEYGIDFGSHTCSHPFLSRIGPMLTEKEIKVSKEIVEDKLNKEVAHFCYPSGDLDREIMELVKHLGYAGACSIIPGGNDSKVDLFALRRTEISGFDTMFDFKKKLAGAYDLIHKAIQFKQTIATSD